MIFAVLDVLDTAQETYFMRCDFISPENANYQYWETFLSLSVSDRNRCVTVSLHVGDDGDNDRPGGYRGLLIGTAAGLRDGQLFSSTNSVNIDTNIT